MLPVILICWNSLVALGSSGAVREGRVMRPRYGILELDQIRAREYVVPDFSEKEDGYFHASIFKWHRGSPDKEMFSTNGAMPLSLMMTAVTRNGSERCGRGRVHNCIYFNNDYQQYYR